MSIIIEKATELADALAASEELRIVREKEATLRQDAEAMALIQSFSEIQNQVQQAQMQGERIGDDLIAKFNEAQNKMEANDIVADYNDSQDKLGMILQQVNNILSQALSNGEEPGCDESQCAGCSGC